MENLTDYGCSLMDNGTKVHHFLQGIKSSELKAAVNVVWVQPEMYRMDFGATMFYLGQIITKKGLTMQSVYIAKTRSQSVRPKVAAFMWNIKCKKYPMAVWNSMTKEQQMQVCQLRKQQGNKPAAKQTSTDARIAALEAKLGINSQCKESGVKKKEGEAPEEPASGRNRGNPAVTCQELSAK